jgi:DNA ligase-1
VPNKPMYRIFDIEDMEELKGFSGQYIVQEKYDGMRIQIHKIDNKVKIYSYNEKDITEKCPEQVKIMENKHFGECILDAELLLFNGEEPLQRAEVVAKIFKDKESDTELRAHVFDIMRHEEKNMVESPLSERIKTLFQNYAQHSHDKLQFPTKKDTREADSLKEIAEYAKDIMNIPTAEGVVIKDITSTYYIGTRKNPK